MILSLIPRKGPSLSSIVWLGAIVFVTSVWTLLFLAFAALVL